MYAQCGGNGEWNMPPDNSCIRKCLAKSFSLVRD